VRTLISAGTFYGQYLRDAPIAADFLRSFISGNPPPDSSADQSSTYCVGSSYPDQVALKFNVGIAFQPGGCGPLPIYCFEKASRTSLKIADSLGLRKIVAGAISSQSSRIAGTFARHPSQDNYNIDLTSVPIEFKNGVDNDLGLAFGEALLDDLRITVSRSSPAVVLVEGHLEDLYDFDPEGCGGSAFCELLDPMGASLQAGFGTLGVAGGVFKSTCHFFGGIYGLPCHWNPPSTSPTPQPQ